MTPTDAPSTHFECVVTETTHGRDIDNYATTSDETWTASARDLPALYEQLAKAKTQETQPERHGDRYVTVAFGLVREICLVSRTPVDLARLEQSENWQAHLRRKEEAQAEQARVEQEATAEQEAREKAELARLTAKWGAPAVAG